MLVSTSFLIPNLAFYGFLSFPPPFPEYKPTQNPLRSCISQGLITGILRYATVIYGRLNFDVLPTGQKSKRGEICTERNFTHSKAKLRSLDIELEPSLLNESAHAQYPVTTLICTARA